MSRKSLLFFVAGLLLSACGGAKDPTPTPSHEPTQNPTQTTPTHGEPTPSEPTPSEPTVPSVTPSPTHGQVTPTEPTTPSMTPSPTHGDPTPSEPTPSPSVITQLDSPVLTVNDDENGLVWDGVKGASYEIKVNENDAYTQNEASYEFAKELGNYVVSVIAHLQGYLDSEPSYFEYEVKDSLLGDVSCEDGVIVPATFAGACLEAKTENGEYVKSTGETYTVLEAGFYTVRAAQGFDEDNNIYYPNNSAEKMIIAAPKAETNYVIEDGSAEDNPTLAEDYSITKYDSSWIPTTASIVLDETNHGYSEGNCVRMNFWHHGMYFMYEKEIALTEGYDALTFLTRATEGCNFTLSFQIKHEFLVGGVDFNGVFVKYVVTGVPTNWTRYTINLDDPAWKINYAGGDYSFEEVATMVEGLNIKLTSVRDLLPYFDSFQFRLYAAYDNIGSNARVYFDDVALLADNDESSIEKIKADITLAKTYAIESEHMSGQAHINGTDVTLNLSVDGYPLTLNAVAEITEDKMLHLVCDDVENGFDALYDSDNGGRSFVLVSVDGPAKEAMEGMKAEAIVVLEDVEEYEETGVGYDQFHAIEERSGMRGAYYTDYYTGNGDDTSPVGGSKWLLMGSTDYSALEKNIAHSGSQSMDLKNSSNAMRFMTYGLSDGTAEGFSGKYFSLWIKGGDKGDMNIRISVYSTKQVTPTNQVSADSRAYLEITVPQNSDWTEYEIPLDENKIYYGFALVNQGQWNGTQRIYVDDIYVYNDISPWGK